MARRGTGGGTSLAVDIGGTFTDVVLVDGEGRTTLGKVPTTPDDPTEGFVAGVLDVLARTGTPPGAVGRVAHATTLATNVILERRGVPVAFVTTQGFRSMLVLGRSARVEEQRFDLFFDAAEPPVPASRCFEVPERVGPGGVVLAPLDEDAAARVADEVAALGVAGVAVCFLHSYANPAHERRMADLLRERLPGAAVVASSEVWPELREYERATTTLMSAYVGPVMAGYLADLARRLGQVGIHAPIHVMESSGGVMSAELAARRAVYTIESGPAAGVMSVAQVGAQAGLGDLLSFDMGGTTAKAGVIRGGKVDITHQFHVGGSGSFGGRREGTGVPIKAPAIDLAEVGAGGGSIAWVDAGGALRVGPRSAGAEPGPACYGRGGDQPTVTDADLVLGYLDPAWFAGGTMALHPDLAVEALRRHVADPLGIDVADAADAVHRIANASMGSAVHVVTVQRGIDPRGFALVALGGAGPVHAARVAERFSIGTVIVPHGSGVGSALGLLTTDLATERSQTHPMAQGDVDLAVVAKTFDELVAAATADLGVERDDVRVERAVDARLLGQAHELTVDAPDGEVGPAWLDELVARFHRRYEEAYGASLRGPVELVSLRARVVRPVDRPGPPAPGRPGGGAGGRAGPPRSRAHRPAFFAEAGGHTPTPVHRRSDLAPGDEVAGPAVIEEPESTTVVPPGWRAEVGERAVTLRHHGGGRGEAGRAR